MTNMEFFTESWLDKKSLKRFLNGMAQVLFHVLLVALSAGIALSLPYVVGFIGKHFWAYTSCICLSDLVRIRLVIAMTTIIAACPSRIYCKLHCAS